MPSLATFHTPLLLTVSPFFHFVLLLSICWYQPTVVVALSSLSSGTSMSSSTTSTAAVHLETLAVAANAYAAAHGVQVERKADDGASVFQCAPISLLPNAYPKDSFAQAMDLAPSFNLLVDRISRDATFLQQTLGGSVSAADPYTAKLLQLYNKIYVTNPSKYAAAASADRLGIHRSDYMLNQQKDSDVYEIKQVELNTIASSFAGLACQVASLHSYLLDRYAASDDDDNNNNNNEESAAIKAFLAKNQKTVVGTTGLAEGVPTNPALQGLPAAMNVAVQRYQERHSMKKRTCVLFVVQEGETNTVDQRMLEFRLFSQHQIPVVRLSLRQIHRDVTCSTDTGSLTLPDGTEIALVYYRAGYAPTDYPGGDDGVEWQAREKLECSRAAKAPSLGYQ